MSIIVRAFGHVAGTLGTKELNLEVPSLTVAALLARLNDSFGDAGTQISKENVLIAIDGVEISAIDGDRSLIHERNTVSLIPVSHGG